MRPRVLRAWIAVAGVALLSGCAAFEALFARLGASTLIIYTPITYCRALVDDLAPRNPDGSQPVLAQQVLVYRIEAIENRQPVAVTIRPALFFATPLLPLPASTVAQRLGTLPPALVLAPGETVASPGVVAVPVDLEVAVDSPWVRSGFFYDVATGQLRPSGWRADFVRLRLDYDPALPTASKPFVTVNRRAAARDVPTQPCTRSQVQSLVIGG